MGGLNEKEHRDFWVFRDRSEKIGLENWNLRAIHRSHVTIFWTFFDANLFVGHQLRPHRGSHYIVSESWPFFVSVTVLLFSNSYCLLIQQCWTIRWLKSVKGNASWGKSKLRKVPFRGSARWGSATWGLTRVM